MSELDLPPVRGQLLRGETLAPFTWFRVGGPADALFLPADEADLAQFLAALDPAVPVIPAEQRRGRRPSPAPPSRFGCRDFECDGGPPGGG